LAEHFSAEVIVIHVVPPMPAYSSAPGFTGGNVAAPSFDVEGYMRAVEVSAQKSLDEVLQKYVLKKVRSRLMLARGEAAGAIVDAARKEGVDAIVIATHGYTGFRRFMYGSVAEKVLRNAECPVLTIPVGES
jgi:nucleotide-binding universal stress UspA family protein